MKEEIINGKKKITLDDIDEAIIKMLQEDAKTSYRVIKEELKISIGTIHNRISKLEENKVIEGYTLKLNNEILGYKLTFLIRVNIDGKHTQEILDEIKILESQGFSFESAEASVALMFQRLEDNYVPPFELIDYSASVEHRRCRGVFAEAMIKILVGGEVIHTAAEGNGPVNALDAALRKGLMPIYPQLAQFKLADYKVRIINSNTGTAAKTRVLIDTQNGHNRWSTVGASTNIIEASWLALVDSVEFGLRMV